MTTALLRLPAALLLLLLATIPAWAAVPVERVVSPGGVEAWLVRDHRNPIVALNLAFRGAGAAVDPAGKEGLSTLTARLLDEGAGEMDSQAFQGRLEDLSISLGFSAGQDNFVGSLKTLTRNRVEAFGLLRLALTRPRFDPEPVERTRSQLLVQLKRESENPDAIAGKTLAAALFPGHPYGRPAQGAPEGVAAATADDMRALVKARFARDNRPDELKNLLDATFGALPARAVLPAVPEVEPAAAGRTVVIRKPVPQSVVAAADAGIKRDDPDYYAAYVLNHILGAGSFTSRLHQEIREKRGLAYSTHSYLRPMARSALVAAGAATANARVAETVGLMRGQWRALAEDGVTAEELADAKTFLTGSFPLQFDSSPAIASILVGMQIDRLGLDYLERRNGLIEKVTRDDVNRVARRLLRPDRLTVVVVGEPEGLDGDR
jgi:zinc protease